jgi:hypothetical protein
MLSASRLVNDRFRVDVKRGEGKAFKCMYCSSFVSFASLRVVCYTLLLATAPSEGSHYIVLAIRALGFPTYFCASGFFLVHNIFYVSRRPE